MTPKEALETMGDTTIHHIDEVGNITHHKVSDSDQYKVVLKALTELEELKNNKLIIDKEDTKRYLNVFERKVLKQIVKEIEDNKKLSKVGKEDV